MALHRLRKLAQNIRDAACFQYSMANECTDITNKEQFDITIRWVGEDLQEHENFIGLYEVEISMQIVPSIASRMLFYGWMWKFLSAVASATIELQTWGVTGMVLPLKSSPWKDVPSTCTALDTHWILLLVTPSSNLKFVVKPRDSI